MFKVEHLRFQFRDGHDVLRDVNFSLSGGEFMAVLGNNGAGKSTMLKCVSRILTPQGGSAMLNGDDLLRLPTREVAKRVAFVAQTVPETAMTVHDTVMLGRRPYMGWSFSDEDHRIVHEAMDKMDVSGMRGRFLNQLSGGERQKVMLARALAQQPKLLLLDEPTSSLDLNNQYRVLETVRDICRRDGIIAMVVIHDLNLALRFCNRFAFFKDGKVYRYGDSSVIDRETIKEVYHVDAEKVEVNGQQLVLVDP